MNALVIPLTSVGHKGRVVDVTTPEPDLALENGAELGLGDVRVCGSLDAIDTEYLFRGHITGAYAGPCDRCLAESAVPFDYEVTWLFEEGEARREVAGAAGGDDVEIDAADDDRMFVFEGNELNLAVPVWEELVLQAPSKHLCKDDCRGLCAHCGADLNRGPCGCKRRNNGDGNKGLSSLADLFPDRRPSSPEE